MKSRSRDGLAAKGLFCQTWSNMQMSNNPAKYEVLIKQYLRSILDISDSSKCSTVQKLKTRHGPNLI